MLEANIISLTSRRESVLHKDKYSFLSTKLNPFTDNINKLPHSQISRYKIPEATIKEEHILRKTVTGLIVGY